MGFPWQIKFEIPQSLYDQNIYALNIFFHEIGVSGFQLLQRLNIPYKETLNCFNFF